MSSGYTSVPHQHLPTPALVTFLSPGAPLLQHMQHTALGIIFQNCCFHYATLSPLLKNFKRPLIIYQTQIPRSRPQEREGGRVLTLHVCESTKHFTDVVSLNPPLILQGVIQLVIL